jgi:hypothetical protein
MGSSFLVDRVFEEMTIEKATDRQSAATRMARPVHNDSSRFALDVLTRRHRSFERFMSASFRRQ